MDVPMLLRETDTLDAAAGAAGGGTEKMSGIEFALVVIGAATLTSWLFKAVDIVEGRR